MNALKLLLVVSAPLAVVAGAIVAASLSGEAQPLQNRPDRPPSSTNPPPIMPIPPAGSGTAGPPIYPAPVPTIEDLRRRVELDWVPRGSLTFMPGLYRGRRGDKDIEEYWVLHGDSINGWRRIRGEPAICKYAILNTGHWLNGVCNVFDYGKELPSIGVRPEIFKGKQRLSLTPVKFEPLAALAVTTYEKLPNGDLQVDIADGAPHARFTMRRMQVQDSDPSPYEQIYSLRAFERRVLEPWGVALLMSEEFHSANKEKFHGNHGQRAVDAWCNYLETCIKPEGPGFSEISLPLELADVPIMSCSFEVVDEGTAGSVGAKRGAHAGKISAIRIEHSSGSKSVDDRFLRLMQRAQPVRYRLMAVYALPMGTRLHAECRAGKLIVKRAELPPVPKAVPRFIQKTTPYGNRKPARPRTMEDPIEMPYDDSPSFQTQTRVQSDCR